MENKITPFIVKYIINNSYINDNINDKICLLKTTATTSIVNYDGMFEENQVIDFCNKYDFYNLKPIDEIDLINRIYNCKILIVNFGSTFFKNYVYISDKCEKIIVIVNCWRYKYEYDVYLDNTITKKTKNLSNIIKKYKNATVHYLITDKLDFDPITL